MATFEDLFEVDSGEAREEAGDEHGGETNQTVLGSGIHRRLARLVALNDRHTKKQEQHGEPLCSRELLLQQGDGEQSSRQNFQLIRNLTSF